jgi:hypothetical protein
MSEIFSRYKVTGEVVDNGDWILVPVQQEASSSQLPEAGDFLDVTLRFTARVDSVSAGYGLLGGGSAGDVVLSVDAETVALKSDLSGFVLDADPRLSDPRAPINHTHVITDVSGLQVALDGKSPVGHKHSGADITSGTVPFLRLPVGSTSTTVCSGADSRLSNARTPTAHKSSHATTGTDPLSPSDIGAAPTASPNFTGLVTVAAAPGAGPSIRFSTDPATGFGQVNGQTGSCSLFAGGNEVVRVRGTGRVGIGGISNPSEALHVGGTIRATSIRSDGAVRAESLTDGTTTKTMSEVLSASSGATSLADLSDVLPSSFDTPWRLNTPLAYVGDTQATAKWQSLSNTFRMYVSPPALGTTYTANELGFYVVGRAPVNNPRFTGSVGVGLGAAEPTATLDVNGSFKATTVSAASATFSASSGAAITVSHTGGGTYLSCGGSAFNVFTNGNVGIGVTVASARLHVDGAVRASHLTDGTTTKSMTEVLAGFTLPSDFPSLMTFSGGAFFARRSTGNAPEIAGGIFSSSAAGLYFEQDGQVGLTATGKSGDASGKGRAIVTPSGLEINPPWATQGFGTVGGPDLLVHGDAVIEGEVRAATLSDGTRSSTVTDLLLNSGGARIGSFKTPNFLGLPDDGGAPPGTVYFDNDYLYIKVGDVGGTWKKTPLWNYNETPQLGGGGAVSQVQLTQAQYNALPTKDPDTLYIIVG